MTRFMKLAALAALVMLVASCGPCRKHRKGDGKPFVDVYKRQVFACLDVDSDRLDAFDREDEEGLKKILSLLFD